MLDITYIGGSHRFIKGKSLRELDQKTPGWGEINFVTNKDGYPFGECPGKSFKASIADVIEITDEAFEAKVAEEKAAGEKQKQEREEMKAALKVNADYEAVVRHNEDLLKRCDAAEAALAKTFGARVKRVFGR